MAAELELGVDPLLDYAQTQLLEPRDRRLRERVEGEVGERRPMPEGLRLPKPGDSGLGVRGSRGCDKVEDARRVQVVAGQTHEVAGRLRHDAIGPKELSELGDGVLEGCRCSPGRLRSPEPVAEPVRGDDLARVEEQEREQCPLIAACQPNRRPPVENLERSEDPELHRGFVAPCFPPG